jgi:DNA-binding GntR family transcriptional regulator
LSTSERIESLKCDHGLRRKAIVESLLSEVVHGRMGPGHHLVTQALADRFGVSHTPIREALSTLAGIGIVDLVPNRGAIVRRVTPRDVREICQVRRALECEAVRNACGRIDLDMLRVLHADLRRLNSVRSPSRPRFIEQARELDSRLHDAIAASCDNSFLTNELGRLKILFRAFRDVSWEHDQAHNDSRRLAQEAGEHLAIVEALLAGDRKEAVAAMSRHVMSGSKYWSRALPVPQAQKPKMNALPSVNGKGKLR